MPKSKVTKRDCIAAIKATAAEGEISDTAARQILADIKTRAGRRAKAKDLKLEDALKEIAGEWVAYQKMGRELQKRNMLLGIKRLREFTDFARSKGYGKGVERYLENIWASWKGLESKFIDRLYSGLKTAGVLEDFKKGRHSKDIFAEMWELSLGAAGKPGVSKNEKALKIAQVYFPLKREMNALKNRHGAYILDAPGHIMIQTHDARLLRRLGTKGFWGKENMQEAFGKWKAFMAGLNIDWERTLDGAEDQDKFMYSFFKNVYTRVFGKEEEVDVDQFRQQGSLASRISSGRVLWFKDADSAWKYNEAFGIKAFNEAVLSDIHQSTRNASLMMHLGPNPKGTLDSGIAVLLKEAEELSESQKQTGALKRSRIDRMFNKLTGLADMAERPTVARLMDNVKAWILMSKGGSIALSSFSDKAFFQNAMVYHGIRALDRLTAQLKAFGPQDRERLKAVAFYLESEIGNIAARWTDDIRPSRALKRGVHWMFDVTGFNAWTRRHRFAAADVLAYTMAQESNLKFGELGPERQRYFKQYDITEAEWDAWRSKTATIKDLDGDSNKVLTPELIEEFTDADLNSIVRSQGLTENSANRARIRDETESKLLAYFSDFVHEAVPEPGLRESIIMRHGARGTLVREIGELLMVFKGFPTTVAMKMIGREKLRLEGGGAKQWWSLADKGKMHVAFLIAEATALGYLSMTVKDMLKGRTPKKLFDDEGKVNMAVVFAAMQRGGGMGIYGDFLFSEYDMRMRDFVSAASGPVISQLNPIADILTSARKAATEADGPSAESIGYKLERFAEDNTPFLNIFYIKPVLDHFIFNALKEGLSPGVLRRQESSVERQGYQEYFISPSEMQSLEPEDRLPYAVKQLTE